MKKVYGFSTLIFLSLAAFCQPITGNWEGKLSAQGTEIPLVFHISKDSSGKLSATFDSPDQKAFNLHCSGVSLQNDSVFIIMKVLSGRYTGKLSDDKKQITGTWFQGGGSAPLTIHKTSDEVKIKEVKRPQTPRPPFPYKSEDVEYDNADKTVHFGGTFTVPLPDSGVDYFRAPIYPTVLLITGSGKQDRDETIFDHKAFAIIADFLTRNGIAVLRVDDRDMGKTTGNFNTSTSADFANDVEAGLDYLKTRKDVDINFIGLLGHSEGGMIAPIVASRRPDVKFIVLLAGPGVKIIDLMEQQSKDVASNGLSKKELDAFGVIYKQLATTITNETNTEKAYEKAVEVFKVWQNENSKSLVRNTTAVTDEKTLNAFIRKFVMQLSTPWFRYFMKFDPADYLTKVKCPVLALNGEKDVQVASRPNLSAIDSALKKANNPNFKTLEILNVNHLFQHCKKCTVDEYEKLEESFAPEVLIIIRDWIKGSVH